MSSALVPKRSAPIYYPSRRGVEVTDRRFTALGRSYHIADLTETGTSMGTVQAGRRLLLRLLAAEVPIVIAIVLVTPVQVAIEVCAGYLVLAGAMLWFGKRHWPTPMELWASYQDRLVLLYTSSDYPEFQRIARALLRSMEAGPRGPVWRSGAPLAEVAGPRPVEQDRDTEHPGLHDLLVTRADVQREQAVGDELQQDRAGRNADDPAFTTGQ